MMKGAAETALPLQVTPGQAGTRHAARGRMGADQLMADFEGLLARQSAIHDAPKDKTDESAPDSQNSQNAQPALSSPEVLFLALAGGGELAPRQDAEELQTKTQPQDGSASAGPAEDGSAPEPAAISPEVPEPVVQAQTPRMRDVVSEKTAAPDQFAVMPKTAVTEAQSPVAERKVGEPIVDPAANDSDDGLSRERADAVPAVEKKTHRNAGEARGAEETGRNQSGPPPVTLIRVAGQETHFTPTPVFLFDDNKVDGLAMDAPTGPEEPSRLQSAPPPVVVKAPGGPLKTLKVELGSTELGLISATMALKDKALDLRIGAVRDDAVASLKEQAGRLSDTLQALGFSVDGVTVQKLHQSDAGAQAGNGQTMQHGAAGQDGSGQNQQRTLNGSGAGAGGSSGQSRHSPHDDHLAEQNGNDQAKNAGGTRNSRDVFL